MQTDYAKFVMVICLLYIRGEIRLSSILVFVCLLVADGVSVVWVECFDVEVGVVVGLVFKVE